MSKIKLTTELKSTFETTKFQAETPGKAGGKKVQKAGRFVANKVLQAAGAVAGITHGFFKGLRS